MWNIIADLLHCAILYMTENNVADIILHNTCANVKFLLIYYNENNTIVSLCTLQFVTA